MAEGFKKYFNGTTMAGRANVAKATYATLALVYLFYRVRRGKGSPPDATDAKMQPNCSCDEKHPSNEMAVEPDRDCTVCRERRPRDDHCKDDPPPPPPASSSSSSGPARRKCPCEDPHRHSDTPKQHMQSAQHERQHSSAAEQLDEAHPARELISQMQEAAGRVLRNVIGAVTGETSPAAAAAVASVAVGDESCSCCSGAPNTADMLEAGEQADDDNCDYESDNQLLSRQRRTAPRACVPSNTSSDPELAAQPELTETEAQGQTQVPAQNQNQAQSAELPTQKESHLPSAAQAQSRFRCFDDDFASEMFFENYEE